MAQIQQNPLRQRADQLHLSCSTLSKATGLPIPTIKGWLRGSHYPRHKDHATLAKGLQISLLTLKRWLSRMHPRHGEGFGKYLNNEAKMKIQKRRKARIPETSAQIKNAVDAYLEGGGSITKLPDDPEQSFFWEDLL